MKYSDLKTDVARVSFLKEKLASDWAWAERGLLAIYQKQTFDEQQARDVKWHNGVGFRPQDADFLTGMTKRVQQNQHLTEKQKFYIFKIMPKYARQLVKIVKERVNEIS